MSPYFLILQQAFSTDYFVLSTTTGTFEAGVWSLSGVRLKAKYTISPTYQYTHTGNILAWTLIKDRTCMHMLKSFNTV